MGRKVEKLYSCRYNSSKKSSYKEEQGNGVVVEGRLEQGGFFFNIGGIIAYFMLMRMSLYREENE